MVAYKTTLDESDTESDLDISQSHIENMLNDLRYVPSWLHTTGERKEVNNAQDIKLYLGTPRLSPLILSSPSIMTTETSTSSPAMPENEVQQSFSTITSLQNGTSSPPQSSLHSLCTDINSRIQSFLQEDLSTARLRSAQAQTRLSLAIIEESLTRYPLSALSLSYNGGKDCLVMLLLYLAVLSKQPDLPPALPAIYIPPPHPFPEMDTFVASSSSHYHLDLSRHQTPKGSMKEAFAAYLASPAGKSIRGVYVGTRRTDPHGDKLSPFDMTDGGWPSFMRVHPMLEWKYVEVWAFLRHLGVEWCSLYDDGFTSLGGLRDTHPNPKLRFLHEGGEERFRPAWWLEDDAEERKGRT